MQLNETFTSFNLKEATWKFWNSVSNFVSNSKSLVSEVMSSKPDYASFIFVAIFLAMSMSSKVHANTTENWNILVINQHRIDYTKNKNKDRELNTLLNALWITKRDFMSLKLNSLKNNYTLDSLLRAFWLSDEQVNNNNFRLSLYETFVWPRKQESIEIRENWPTSWENSRLYRKIKSLLDLLWSHYPHPSTIESNNKTNSQETLPNLTDIIASIDLLPDNHSEQFKQAGFNAYLWDSTFNLSVNTSTVSNTEDFLLLNSYREPNVALDATQCFNSWDETRLTNLLNFYKAEQNTTRNRLLNQDKIEEVINIYLELLQKINELTILKEDLKQEKLHASSERFDKWYEGHIQTQIQSSINRKKAYIVLLRGDITTLFNKLPIDSSTKKFNLSNFYIDLSWIIQLFNWIKLEPISEEEMWKNNLSYQILHYDYLIKQNEYLIQKWKESRTDLCFKSTVRSDSYISWTANLAWKLWWSTKKEETKKEQRDLASSWLQLKNQKSSFLTNIDELRNTIETNIKTIKMLIQQKLHKNILPNQNNKNAIISHKRQETILNNAVTLGEINRLTLDTIKKLFSFVKLWWTVTSNNWETLDNNSLINEISKFFQKWTVK